MLNHTRGRALLLAVLALAAVSFVGCATGTQSPRQVGEVPEYGTVRLALACDHPALAAYIELRFDPADGRDPIVDVFALAGDTSQLSRTYRLPPGDYTIEALGIDDVGDTVLEGARPRTEVEPGDNIIVLPLTPTGADPRAPVGEAPVARDEPRSQVRRCSSSTCLGTPPPRALPLPAWPAPCSVRFSGWCSRPV